MQDLAFIALSVLLVVLTWGMVRLFHRYEERSR